MTEIRAAGVVSRGVAAVIDLIIVATVLAAIYLGLILTRLMFHPTAFRAPTMGAVFSTAVLFGVAVCYLTACWAVSGCTVGSVTMGLRVIGRRGRRLSPAVALLRAVACVLLPVGLLWVAVDRHRRSLQDIVFGSRVVYARP
ncbi:RDD family protein [Mycolicibacterium fluoranthenivorans]|uniref:Putative RDD family membrane protein YckC n=1 Tax=Mycolicibacterium fluoranthenivorans TaxID=258505 RepID=A0A7X5ZGM0_9MYCO|nr:RDD family protein [Mycolicibacterium fluoranthenivorans]NIH99267.1 putative RDD family membrane protein YckC [Mycolicibacterium fluoranthenivorans]